MRSPPADAWLRQHRMARQCRSPQRADDLLPARPPARWKMPGRLGSGSSGSVSRIVSEGFQILRAAHARLIAGFVANIHVSINPHIPSMNSPHGLAFWTKFAKDHGKPLAIPEWGLVWSTHNHGGKDNPHFIEQMHAFIHDVKNNVAFHCYFDINESDHGNQLSPGAANTDKKEGTEFPRAALARKLSRRPPAVYLQDRPSASAPGAHSKESKREWTRRVLALGSRS